MSRAARAPGRRPIADFLAYAREQPNQALAVGLGALVVIALAVFGIVHLTGGSTHSDQAAARTGGGNGAQIASNSGGSGGSGGGSSGSSKSTSKSGSHAPGSSGASSPTSKNGSGSTSKAGQGHTATPTTLFVPHIPVTTVAPPIPLPQSQQKWIASPSNIHMKAGAFPQARGWVVVLNESDQKGIVDAPGCSGPPSPTPAQAVHSCGAGSPIVVQPHQDVKVMWTWHATQTGRAGAPPLAPGSYFFAIGPVNVHVTVK